MKSTRRSLDISIVGAGKVGSTLAVILHRSGNRIVAVISRKKRSARKCGMLVACRNCSDDLSAIPSSSDVVILAVPDQSIHSVAASLTARSHLEFRRMAVCHTSGALTSDELQSIARRGARVFSLHPIQTFPRKKSLDDQIQSMEGITYGVEGPRASLAAAKRLVRQLGGDILIVPKEAKNSYHCACVIASNYSVALIGAVESIVGAFSKKGLLPFRRLIETSIGNAMKTGAGRALTGPIIRGDVEIVARHLKSLSDPRLKALYRALGEYTLVLASREHTVSRAEVQRLRKLLQGQG